MVLKLVAFLLVSILFACSSEPDKKKIQFHKKHLLKNPQIYLSSIVLHAMEKTEN